MNKWVRWGGSSFAVLVFVVVLMLVGWSLFQTRHPGVRIKAESSALLTALESYRTDRGALPEPDQQVIFRELTSGAGGGKVYIVWPAKRTAPDGRFLDPLGHPYLFKFDGAKITVLSAGRDGVPDSADDFVGASR